MIPKRLEDITPTDIERLIEDRIAEQRSIEYKRAVPGPTAEGRREFLYDVASFANAEGGDIIYGVTEEAGLPVSIAGLKGVDLDAVMGRLQSSLQTGIDPRITSLTVA